MDNDFRVFVLLLLGSTFFYHVNNFHFSILWLLSMGFGLLIGTLQKKL